MSAQKQSSIKNFFSKKRPNVNDGASTSKDPASKIIRHNSTSESAPIPTSQEEVTPTSQVDVTPTSSVSVISSALQKNYLSHSGLKTLLGYNMMLNLEKLSAWNVARS